MLESLAAFLGMPDFLLRALLGGVGVALLAGPLGCFVVWRRMAYFGETLTHSAFLGVGLGLLLHIDPIIGVGTMGAVIALILARRHPNEGLAEDTLLGLLAHSSLALGLVLLAFMEDVRVDLFAYLFGDILALRPQELLWIGVADVLGLELQKVKVDDSSFGTAMLTAVGIGWFDSFAHAAETCVEIDSVSRPDPATHELYEKLFLKYKAVHDALAPIYRG